VVDGVIVTVHKRGALSLQALRMGNTQSPAGGSANVQGADASHVASVHASSSGRRARAGGQAVAGGSGRAAGPTAADATSPAPLVFLSHAGEQKHSFVDCLHTLLTRTYKVAPVFLDERTLEPGTHNEPAMRGAIGRAPAGAPPVSLWRVEAGIPAGGGGARLPAASPSCTACTLSWRF
jgi:hypothetical protein